MLAKITAKNQLTLPIDAFVRAIRAHAGAAPGGAAPATR